MSRARATTVSARLALVVVVLAAGVTAATDAGAVRPTAALTGSGQESAGAQQAATAGMTTSGRGYGHGRGMSQYGAQGAALAGRTATQILSFYYPGTAVGKQTGYLRIRLTADTTDGVRVVTARNLRVRDITSGQLWTLPGSPSKNQWSLDPYGEHGTRLSSYDTAKRVWTVWKSPEGRTVFPGMAQFEGPGIIPLLLPDNSLVWYRGTLRTADTAGATFDTINHVGMEAYLRGVVPKEAISSWRPAALQAQSVAARTYSMFYRRRATAAAYDLCDTSACQVYGGFLSEQATTTTAILATSGQVRLYGGLPIIAEFGTSNGGVTAAGPVPYQVAKADSWDAYPGNRNPYAAWSVTKSPAALQAAFGLGVVKSIKVTSRTGIGPLGGRVLKVQVVGATGSAVLTGDQVRQRLALRSSLYSFGSLT